MEGETEKEDSFPRKFQVSTLTVFYVRVGAQNLPFLPSCSIQIKKEKRESEAQAYI